MQGSYSQIAEALNYAADKMVRVVNMSFGGPPSEALRATLDVAASRGMSLVVAAGNHRCDFASVHAEACLSPKGVVKGFPAAYGDLFPNLIAVAAIAANGKPTRFTNFDSSKNPKIHVLAPGENIITCSDASKEGKACT
ncbi:subtilase family serine protease, putative [Eimeria praecox]|uniref:subtilisin n=1 Tax=Eimeria praecox TaxID=51316 RepID=U6GSS3_9EIME|nr:subtilase family serine protease, putative [Eimeria praecox]